MLDVPRTRIEDVESRVTRPNPDEARIIDEQRDDCVACERSWTTLAVPKYRELIGAAVPARQSAVAHRDPQIVVSIFGNGLDVVARKSVRSAAPITISNQPMPVITHQAVLSAKPHETLAVLQRGIDSALWQPISGGQMLENRGRLLGDSPGGRLHED